MNPIPKEWLQQIDKTRVKAYDNKDKIVGIDKGNFIVAGKIIDVSVDKLLNLEQPYCMICLQSPIRYNSITGNQEGGMGDQEVVFLNKPEMLLALKELKQKFPKVFEEVHVKLRGEQW